MRHSSTGCNQTPPCSTGAVSPANPGYNQDVWSRSSWHDLQKYRKSAKCSKFKIHAKYSRIEISRKQYLVRRLVLDDLLQQFVLNTFSRISITVLATTSVVPRGASNLKICNILPRIFTWCHRLLVALIAICQACLAICRKPAHAGPLGGLSPKLGHR